MEEAPWRRNQGGGIMEEESCRRHPGATQETSRRHPGGPAGTQEAPRNSQEAPRRHPEAPRSPGASWTQNVSYHMRLCTKVVGASDFACTGAT